MNKAMREIIRDHRNGCVVDWFSPGAMAFFNTRLCDTTPKRLNDRENTRFFITGERMDDTEPERFTIRMIRLTDEGHKVTDFSRFQQFATEADAVEALALVMDSILDGLTLDAVQELLTL